MLSGVSRNTAHRRTLVPPTFPLVLPIPVARFTSDQLLDDLVDVQDLLIVQDLDGVCMQLVKDPLTRELDRTYVEAAASLADSFVVLTNGEHEGHRGVNRLVERALGDASRPAREGLYLPGLAAGGVQMQDRHGQLSHPGVSADEMAFLDRAPERMEELFLQRLAEMLPECAPQQLRELAHAAVLDTQLSPTINLNGVFPLVAADVVRQRALQDMLQQVMDQLLNEASAEGLDQSFFLHVAPNLGRDADGNERLKPAEPGDVGSTDIQFMLTGSLKEAGLLVLLNRYVAARWGEAPLGDDFHVRNAPRRHADLFNLVKSKIPAERVPLLVGVGDTVTSTPTSDGSGWLRGGSDRGFLRLLQEIGGWSGQGSRVVLVDSSHGEVDRPSLSDGRLIGVSDPQDPLKLDVVIADGPSAYVSWFRELAKRRASNVDPV